ncbi:hypothetical protein KAZ01_01765, partial [Candidatus Gracilibacteria bacterium]|nr:hypothetical protein [Candidatus Gracilibacteria bacterium]
NIDIVNKKIDLSSHNSINELNDPIKSFSLIKDKNPGDILNYNIDASENYNLLLKKGYPINIGIIKNVLKKYLRTDEETIEKRLKKNKGILFTNISFETARRIQIDLESLSQQTALFQHTQATIFKEIIEVSDLEITDNFLTINLNQNTNSVTWQNVIFLSVAAIISDKKNILPNRAFDILSVNPNLHLRIWDKSLKQVKITPFSEELSLNFIPLIELVNKNTPKAKKSITFEGFLKSKALIPKTFNTIEEYDNLITWEIISEFGKKINGNNLLNLIIIGLEIKISINEINLYN